MSCSTRSLHAVTEHLRKLLISSRLKQLLTALDSADSHVSSLSNVTLPFNATFVPFSLSPFPLLAKWQQKGKNATSLFLEFCQQCFSFMEFSIKINCKFEKLLYRSNTDVDAEYTISCPKVTTLYFFVSFKVYFLI